MTNRVFVAAAGSRKTTLLVEEALTASNRKTLLTTYTNENRRQIQEYLEQRKGVVPACVRVQTWFSFLLQECVRPYQNFLYDKHRIETIAFVQGKSTTYTKKKDVSRYYLAHGKKIYTDKIGDFVCKINDQSDGLVIGRLESIFDRILIDETQDLAGYDYDFLELLLASDIAVTLVGDCRQATYFTNCSPKNARYRGHNIVDLFRDWERRGLCTVTEKTESFRCNQRICDFADLLYPDLNPTRSRANTQTGHDGVFVVPIKNLDAYCSTFKPVVLRDGAKTSSMGLPAINFGLSKGQTFERVLILPNGPIENYLASGNPGVLKPQTRARFYVAITRARHSVAIVTDKRPVHDNVQIYAAAGDR